MHENPAWSRPDIPLRGAPHSPVPVVADADSGSGRGTARAWVSDQFAGPFGGSRILIIDDDASVARTLSRVLRRAGLTEITVCADPDEGAAWCKERSPDLVFLDLHLPGWDGFQALDHLRTLTSGGVPVPIVMLTGDNDVRHKRRALAQGAADFLLKPFDAMEVILRTRALLQTQALQRQLREQNRTLESRVAERTRQLEATQLEMLHRLAVAAELHDDATGQHTQRVGVLAGRLARALGLSAAQVELIARAAPLHDLGKVGVPDVIVQKRGTLTTEEFDVIKTHAAIGARILAGGRSELIQVAERIAMHHHERWDGAGYPAGLAGDAIPLEARIVGAVDFFDALTHDRPYRPAYSVDRTLAMIREGSGSHFDPAVAAALVALVTESGLTAGCDAPETGNEVAA